MRHTCTARCVTQASHLGMLQQPAAMAHRVEGRFLCYTCVTPVQLAVLHKRHTWGCSNSPPPWLTGSSACRRMRSFSSLDL
eukprot:3423359-Pyramimonas_sp.AAC.1